DVGKTVCIVTARDTWLICTDATAPTGGGAWKDTGVPCKEPQPKGPADYRPVPEGPHPTTPPVTVKRVVDMFRGIVFRCMPSAHISWSTDACTRITAEFTSQAKAASVTVVILDAADDDAAKAQKVEAAGLRLDEAIDWVVKLGATTTDGAYLKEDVDGVLEVVPGIYNRKPVVLIPDADLDPATAAQALGEAKADFSGAFEYLTQQR
ncbi:MAG TPA: hypothetical protein VM782_02010, partial [Stellaceae bacterium]|nr:hypothetical protein [Stellaceae bacterium]